MKKSMMLFMCLLCISMARAQLKTTIIGTSERDEIATDVKRLSDGSAIIVGYSFIEDVNGDVTDADAFVMRVDPNGHVMWQNDYGHPFENDFVQDMIITKDEQYVVFCGNSRPEGTLEQNTAFICKYDVNGTIAGGNTFRDDDPDNLGGEVFYGLTELDNGNFVVVGTNDKRQNKSASLVCVYNSGLSIIHYDVYNTHGTYSPDGIHGSDEFTAVTSVGNIAYITGFVFNKIYYTRRHDSRLMCYDPSQPTMSTREIYDRYYDINAMPNSVPLEVFVRDNTIITSGYVSSDAEGKTDNAQYIMRSDMFGSNASIETVVIDNKANLDPHGNPFIFANTSRLYPINKDRMFLVEHPSSFSYEPLFNGVINTVDAMVSDFTFSNSVQNNTGRIYTVDGKQSILGIDIEQAPSGNDGWVYLAGTTIDNNDLNGSIGRRDILFVQATYDLKDNVDECNIDDYDYTSYDVEYFHPVQQYHEKEITIQPEFSFLFGELQMLDQRYCGKLPEEGDCDATFTYSSETSTPQNYTFNPSVHNSGNAYDWTENGTNISNSPTSFTHTFAGYGTHEVCLKQSNPVEYCQSCLDICVNEPEVTKINPQYSEPCNLNFFWTVLHNKDIAVTPPIQVAGRLYFDYIGQPTNFVNVPANPHFSYLHTYAATGTYKICFEDNNCRTCIDICINDRENTPEPPPGGQPKPTTVEKVTRGSMDLGLISIVPNPTTSTANVNLVSTQNKKVNVMLTDISGRVVLNKYEYVNAGKSKLTIPMSELSNGIYILNITDGKTVLREKVVKQ